MIKILSKTLFDTCSMEVMQKTNNLIRVQSNCCKSWTDKNNYIRQLEYLKDEQTEK